MYTVSEIKMKRLIMLLCLRCKLFYFLKYNLVKPTQILITFFRLRSQTRYHYFPRGLILRNLQKILYFLALYKNIMKPSRVFFNQEWKG